MSEVKFAVHYEGNEISNGSSYEYLPTKVQFPGNEIVSRNKSVVVSGAMVWWCGW